MSHVEQSQSIWEFLEPHMQPVGQRKPYPVLRMVPARPMTAIKHDPYRDEMQRLKALRLGHKRRPREAKLESPIRIAGGTPVPLSPAGKPQARSVLAATISASGISHEILVGPARSQYIVVWRVAGMYLARRLCKASFPKIGRLFFRDHTTVMHAHSIAEGREEIMRCADAIRALLK